MTEQQAEKLFIEKIGYCEGCRIKDDTLVVHHLEKKLSHPDKRFDVDNWCVLCWKCHLITEQGGYVRAKKYTAKEFNDYLKNVIIKKRKR